MSDMKCKNCRVSEVATVEEWVDGWGDVESWSLVRKGLCAECAHDDLKEFQVDEHDPQTIEEFER